ncbi:hypothetical protein GALMADRAFT_153207 [Galerina marginata CBS 339.88]|uniref:Uncharacterized protein n=1 Tax=Galerina marginata (strain CBS 339.88) TaxID=685588 RepID=A0A067TP66_GALM3|nr:hypothetical protein GALMADRAFT_153207 [Galerina marginata CBS 339.88]
MIKIDSSKADSSMASALLVGVASLVLLFTCLSSPVVDTLYVYRMSTILDGAIRYVEVGLWGYCVDPLRVIGYNPLVFDPNVVEGCIRSKVGFSLDANVAAALHSPLLDGQLSKAHTGLFILYPIATALSILFCAFQTLFHLFKNHTRSMQVRSTSGNVAWLIGYAGITSFLVTFALVLQVSILIYAKSQLHRISTPARNLTFHAGNTIWLSVVGFICHAINLSILITLRKSLKKAERDEEAKSAIRKGKKSTSQEKARQGECNLEESKANTDALNFGKHPLGVAGLPPYDLDGYLEKGNSDAKVAGEKTT